MRGLLGLTVGLAGWLVVALACLARREPERAEEPGAAGLLAWGVGWLVGLLAGWLAG